MAIDKAFLSYILDQLSEFGEIKTKNMFGGVGFFKEGLMFGKIGNDTFRLKVDKFNQDDYEKLGMKPFFSETKKKGMPYWEVPQTVIQNPAELAQWADKALEAAKRNKK